jgi:hypothetical protein
MNKLKKILKSKTMLFSLLLVVFGVVEANLALFQSFIPPQYWGLVVTGIGIVTAVLRFVTTTSLDEK